MGVLKGSRKWGSNTGEFGGFGPKMGGVKGTLKFRDLGVLTPKQGIPKFAPNWRFLPQNWGPEMEPGMGFQYWGIWGFWPQNGGLKGDPKMGGIWGFLTPKRGTPKFAQIGVF